jgi:hypothetical protein
MGMRMMRIIKREEMTMTTMLRMMMGLMKMKFGR